MAETVASDRLSLHDPLIADQISGAFTSYRSQLFRLAITLVDDPATAEDITQDAFLALAAALERGQTVSLMYPFLRRCVTNLSHSALRRRIRKRAFLNQMAEPPPISEGIDSETFMAIRQAVISLSARQREVIVLFYYEDLGINEIAQILSISTSSVTSALSRARIKIGHALGDEYK